MPFYFGAFMTKYYMNVASIYKKGCLVNYDYYLFMRYNIHLIYSNCMIYMQVDTKWTRWFFRTLLPEPIRIIDSRGYIGLWFFFFVYRLLSEVGANFYKFFSRFWAFLLSCVFYVERSIKA